MVQNKRLLLGALLGAITIFLVWAMSAVLILRWLPSNEEHGTFGDLFGAVNALFSGLAFLGVIIAIILQKMELEEQRKEIARSACAQAEAANSLRRQYALNGLLARVEALNHVISGIDRQIDRMKASGRSDAGLIVRNLVQRQEQLESVLEKLLSEIEHIEEDKHNAI